ncbi:MAG: glycoside hydrolase family 36 protein [Melioribacteraceae bacterium]
MQKFSKLNISLIIVFCFNINIVAFSTTSSDQINAKRWALEKFAKGYTPPFSFIYGGKSSDTFIKDWEYKAENIKSFDPNVEQFIYTYSDKQTGLVVKCFVTCNNDYNAVEYVLRFTNNSSQNTPIIEGTSVINNVFSYNTGGDFILHHSLGSNMAVNDFQPIDELMQLGKNIYMTPSRGRSSDETALPFFNIESPARQGIVVAVGWTGKWFANVVQKDEKSFSLNSGMENMHLTLYPKEEIRTPKICLLFWSGEDRMIGHNQFRSFILSHHTRKINGQNPELPLSVAFELDGAPSPCTVHTCLTETSALAHIKRYQQFKLTPELYWIDAGWYSGCGWDKENGNWSLNVGNWTVDKERFPNGLKPISDAVHAAGAKFMVWVEPERVKKGTQLYNEHPNWLLSKGDSDDYLLNIGNTETRLWLTNYLTGFFEKEGIDYYRQDFNMDPFPYWKKNDSPDRIGISEAKHIEGLYAFWDSLLVRFPNLIIDNCAAGGRRIDLETTSRSTPFWRSDLEQNSTGYQCHTFGLNLYLPLHGTALYRTGNYYLRSSLGSTAVINWSVAGSNNETIYSYQKYMADFKRLRQYYYGDFYPITLQRKHYMDNDFWLAYQLNRPDRKDGIVLAFRREKNIDESIHAKFKGLIADSNYELYYEDYGINIIKSGKELMDGIEIRIMEKPGSLLIIYKEIGIQ